MKDNILFKMNRKLDGFPLRCNTYVSASTVEGAGYGVFSSMFIKAGCIVEESVVLPVPYEVLSDYRIIWDADNDCIGTGNIELINHSEDPNAEFMRDFDRGLLVVRAIRNIKADEEIFVKYACGPWWEDNA